MYKLIKKINFKDINPFNLVVLDEYKIDFSVINNIIHCSWT